MYNGAICLFITGKMWVKRNQGGVLIRCYGAHVTFIFCTKSKICDFRTYYTCVILFEQAIAPT